MTNKPRVDEAKQIISDYAQKCSTVDEGNLYFAATQLEAAYQALLEQAERMAFILQEIKANKNANRGDWHRAIDGLKSWQEFKR